MDASSPQVLNAQDDDDPGSSAPAPAAEPAAHAGHPELTGAASAAPAQPNPKRSLMASLQEWISSRIPQRSNGDIRQNLEEMMATDTQGATPSDLGDDERTMISNILRYHQVRVDDVMVPRADIVAIEDTEDFDDLVQLFMRASHSRIPVYSGTMDNVVGMVHIKDVVSPLTGAAPDKQPAKAGTRAPKPQISTLLRSVLFAPPSMRVIDLLARMRAARVHMAIVIDEYGGTDGLITIEDLVEQIVGEIEDEHDSQDADPLVAVEPGEWLADARIPIEDLEAAVGLELHAQSDDVDVDTLGGLVFYLCGKVPAIGDQVRHKAGLLLEIIDGDPRRITRVRVSLDPDDDRTGANSGSAP